MKRRMATLAIVGAMAVAAMAPATVFAAVHGTDTTNVSYKANGIPVDNGRLVVMVPNSVSLDDAAAVDFEVEVLVRNAAGTDYVTPGGTNPTMGKQLHIGVESTNDWTVVATGDKSLTYSYTANSKNISTGDGYIGVFQDAGEGGTPAATYSFPGTMELTQDPAVDDTAAYTDSLIFTVGDTQSEVTPTPGA